MEKWEKRAKKLARKKAINNLNKGFRGDKASVDRKKVNYHRPNGKRLNDEDLDSIFSVDNL